MSIPGLLARYEGTCSECGGPISVGELIVRDEVPGPPSYSHEECPDPFPEDEEDALSVDKRTPLCPRCFLFHQGECF